MTTAALGLGLSGWLLSLLFTGATALLLARLLRTRRLSLDAAVTLFLWIWVTTLITFILGLSGLLAAGALGVTSAIGLAVLLVIRPTRAGLLETIRGWRRTKDRIVEGWRGLPRWLRWCSAGFLAFSAIRFAILIWALPPFVWDSLTYHLTNVAQWIQDGQITLFEAPVERIYSPANYEVLAAWFAVFVHHDVVIEAAGIPAYALAGLSVYSVTRAFRMSSVGSWAATIAYLSTPALVYAATGTKNDPFVGAVFLLMVALVLHLKNDLETADDTPVLSYLILMVLALGYALGTKAYILQLAAGVLLLTVLPGQRIGAREQWTRGKEQMTRDLRTRPRGARVLMLGLIVCGLFLGGYWNVRNWVLKGNPFYPYEVAVEAQSDPSTGSGHYGLGLARLEENLLVLGLKFGDKHSRILPDLPDTTGWGWLAYGMGLAATLWAILVDRRFRFLALGFALSMLLLMASNTTSRWNMRYFIWLPALFSVAIGLFIDPVESLDVSRRRAVTALFSFGLGMNAIMAVNYNLVGAQDFLQMLSLPVLERDAGRFRLRAPEEFEHAYVYVPREARLGYNVHENGFIYPLYRADFSQRLVFVPASADDSCEEIAQAMEARGTRYLFVAPEHTDDSLLQRLRECARRDSPIRERASGLYVVKQEDP